MVENLVEKELERLDIVADIFKVLADETRLKVAYMLLKHGELCVCDTAELIGASTATTSHHLRLLQSKGLTKKRREGKHIMYSLDDHHVSGLIQLALEHSKELICDGED